MPATYPPIADHGFLGDCHTAALVSREGSVDWWCVPRFDSGTAFGRLLDQRRGGFFELRPGDVDELERSYVEGTLVLRTTFSSGDGEATVTDCLAVSEDAERHDEHRRLVRIVEGTRGRVRFGAHIEPRFDYGGMGAWIRAHGGGAFSAIGGDDGLILWSDAELEAKDDALESEFAVERAERVRFAITFLRPEDVDAGEWEPPSASELDDALDDTIEWWREWTENLSCEGPQAESLAPSARLQKALSYGPTGAMAAAATTSLPETSDGHRRWDYRYTWIRDSALSSRSLAQLGCEAEADSFRKFIERTAAGDVADLRILYGVGGERRLGETELPHLEGWRGAAPVVVGNDAGDQTQLDACGLLVVQSWLWHERGHTPDEYYWRFLCELVESATERWDKPDAGIWEWRGEPKHFVHSKVLSWAAPHYGLRLAEDCGLDAPKEKWARVSDEIREAIESEGYDERRGVFVQAFGSSDLDAAVLRLPTVGFIEWDDERMVRTADAIRDRLSVGGLIRRYDADDELPGQEGAFLACSFWLAEVLVRQGRLEEARETCDAAAATANDLGLFSEEYDPGRGEMLGNFPQALTHLSHVEALLAFEREAGQSGFREEPTGTHP
jgi:GH15 family glucan-1,4-alpha-glucosidase